MRYTALLVIGFLLISYLAYYSTLEMEATCSSETSVTFQRNTRRCITEDKTLHNHRCENLKSYIIAVMFTHHLDWIYRVILNYCRGFRGLNFQIGKKKVKLLTEYENVTKKMYYL
jgi:hypothetical protein